LRRLFAFIYAGVIASSFLLAPSAFALEKVTLQLKWNHAYQFSGYYAAKELGYYQDAGLDVQIIPLRLGTDVIHEVVSANANFGTGSSSLLLARQDGVPVVVLAAIFQHSPYALIARKFSESQTIHDLDGKPILLRRLSDELIVYLKREHIDRKNVIGSVPGMDTVEQLKAGKVSAISGYVSNEPYLLKSAGVPYEIYSPRSAGIDVYGDNLFTSEAEIKKNPERVELFRQASLRGWEYVLNNPEKAQEIVRKYDPNVSPQKLEFEVSKINPLIRSDLVPIGFMSEGRWKHTVDIYREAGALNQNFDLAGFIYDPNPKRDLRWAYGGLIFVVITLLIFAAALYYIFRLNRRLRQSLEMASHLAQHDVLTGLPNRILFADRLQRAILKAKRDKNLLAVIFVDVDHFKSINDGYGHQEGDEVLKAFSNRMIASIRDSDSLGRIGGDEFVILLEDLPDISGAMGVAKKIQSALSTPVSANGSMIAATVSMGIAVFPEDALNEEDLFKCADLAMYEAKQAGRNQIFFYSAAIGRKTEST
jgi:diguanylate cyclase (GGDEF)-like protein